MMMHCCFSNWSIMSCGGIHLIASGFGGLLSLHKSYVV